MPRLLKLWLVEQGKNIDSEIAYRQGNLANEQTRTGIAGRQADTAACQADTSAASQAEMAKYHEGELAARNRGIDIRDKNGKVVSAAQQAYAVDNALRELATDPKFKDYVIPNTARGTFDMAVDDGSLMI